VKPAPKGQETVTRRSEDSTNVAVCPARTTEPADTGRRPPITGDLRDRLVRLAYRFLWNQDDAEDAVQDALAVAHEQEDRLRVPARWFSWVCRIVVQRCRLHGRRRQRWLRQATRFARPVEAEPTTTAGRDEHAEALRQLVSELPRRQQEVIVLRYLQQMSYEQIAEVLGIAPSTARVHAQAGLETLRDRLLMQRPGWFEDPDSAGGNTA